MEGRKINVTQLAFFSTLYGAKQIRLCDHLPHPSVNKTQQRKQISFVTRA